MNFKNCSFANMPSNFQTIAFGEITWAISQESLKFVEETLEKYSSIISSKKDILANLQYYLLHRLSSVITPCFTSEMALQNSLGKLKASDSRKRYLEFVELAIQENFLENLFKHYPVLLSSIEKTLSHWKESVIEFLERLSKDFAEIQKTFSKSETMQLRYLYTDLSDVHNSGRTVFKLIFNDFTLIYKPKDLQIEKAFNNLIEEINVKGFTPSLKFIKVLPKENYGWVEFVNHYACLDLNQVKNFYFRAGCSLFLWYLFEGTDAHFENLICHGEYPVMIDVETLFHSDLYDNSQEIDPFKNTILRTGLLPFVGGLNAVNYGGLTASLDEMIPQFHHQFDNVNTDSMELRRKTSFVDGNKHLVYLNDAPMSFLNHIEDICQGFQSIFEFFCSHKDTFLQSQSFLKLLNSKIRIVMRGTANYDYMRQCLNFPTNLISENQRNRFLQANLYNYLDAITENERNQLLNLDIPYFYSFPNSKNLYATDGTCFPNFFMYPIADLVKLKLEKLNHREMNKQLKLLRTSLSCFTAKKSKSELSFLKKSSLEVVHHIADYVQETKKLLREDSIYNGRLGIALFFASLFKVCGDKKWKKAAEEIIKASISNSLNSRNLCAFSGSGSVLYALMKTGQLLENESLIAKCLQLVENFPEQHLKNCTRLDFVGGLSGFTTVLTTCYKQTKNRKFLDLALKSGEEFLQKFPEEKQHEIGLSHGLAGYAHGLIQLGICSKNSKFIDYAKTIIDLEQRMYLDSKDLKFNSWCHGHTGIALSRLANLKYCDNETTRKEITLAITKTKNCLGYESSLCCGDFGRYAFLMDYARQEKITKLEKEVRQLAYLFVQEYIRTSGENPCLKEDFRFGFMQGIAGIGYGLLKLTHPTKLPQVLLLQ